MTKAHSKFSKIISWLVRPWMIRFVVGLTAVTLGGILPQELWLRLLVAIIFLVLGQVVVIMIFDVSQWLKGMERHILDFNTDITTHLTEMHDSFRTFHKDALAQLETVGTSFMDAQTKSEWPSQPPQRCLL